MGRPLVTLVLALGLLPGCAALTRSATSGLADKHFVDLAASVFVGDSESDRQAARAARVGRFVWAHDPFGWGAP